MNSSGFEKALVISIFDMPNSEITALGCDTGVALPDTTKERYMILGKNSDRRISESQRLEINPGQLFKANTVLQLEHRSISQVRQTYSTLGAGPCWCWGYEEGMNEYRVAIGNEAIRTKTYREAVNAYRAGRSPELGLLGMDIVRLALERSKTAVEAVVWIGQLVERYGQFGCSLPGDGHGGGYDNSYIVADPIEAWVVETYGRHWTALKLTEGSWAISNEPCITTNWDMSDSDIVNYAVEKGWWPANRIDEFNASLAYIDFHFPAELSYSRARRFRQLLAEKAGSIDVAWFRRILRDHYETTFRRDAQFNPSVPGMTTICMHASPSGSTWTHTASSAIFVLPQVYSGKLPVLWWCAGPPCNSVYVPVFLNSNKLPAIVEYTGTAGKEIMASDRAIVDVFSPASYWWEFRKLCDLTRGDEIGSTWNQRNPIVRKAFDDLEIEFERDFNGIESQAIVLMGKQDIKDAELTLRSFTEQCFKKCLDSVYLLQQDITKHGEPLSLSSDLR
jgi:secernin